MDEPNYLSQIFSQVAKRMRADFEESRSAVAHRGSAGSIREDVFSRFLQAYLPQDVRVAGSGEVVSSDGNRSKQIDVLITDNRTPPLYAGGAERHAVVPTEAVYGVVEVKTNLTKATLLEACENIRSAKRLEKLAFGSDVFGRQTTRYGRTWTYTPTLGVIFAFESASLEHLGRTLHDWCADVPHEERPDSVWVLDKGGLSWSSPNEPHNLEGYSSPGSYLRAIGALDDGILLPLVLRLNHQFQQVFSPPFDLQRYTRGHDLATWSHTWPPQDQPSKIPR
jgi:hypothetical protein